MIVPITTAQIPQKCYKQNNYPSVFKKDPVQQQVIPFSKPDMSGYVGVAMTVGTFITVNTMAEQITPTQRNRLALSCIAISSIVYLTILIIEHGT